MSKKEFTPWEQFLMNLKLKAFVNFGPLPISDCPPDRYLERSHIKSSSPVQWPEGWADMPLDWHVRGDLGPSGNMRGWPVQRYAPDAVWQTWTEQRYGTRTPVKVPVPIDMPHWLEGHAIRGGAWDRHWLGVCPERQEAVEMIWAVPGRYECNGWGLWRDGQLVDGRPVSRAGVSLTARLWNRDDSPHQLAVHISGDDKDPSTHHEHPTTGDVLTLSPKATTRLMDLSTSDEQRRWLTAAFTYGMMVVDRNGATKPHMLMAPVSGPQWLSSSLPALDIRMTDLELAIF